MSESTSTSIAQAPDDAYQLPSKAQLREQWLSETLEALSFSGFISDKEKDAVSKEFLNVDITKAGRQIDVLEALVYVRAGDGADMRAMTEDLAYITSLYLSPSPILVPFIPSMMPPSPFYEKWPALFELAKTLLCPVVYAEENEVFGVASMNSVAADLMATEMSNFLQHSSGAKPFISVTRIDHRGWENILHHHFGL